MSANNFFEELKESELKEFGYVNPFWDEMVSSYGYNETIDLLTKINVPKSYFAEKYSKTMAEFILGLSGLWNGCRWCAIGHMYAANVFYFKDNNTLFPVPETIIPELELLEFKEVWEKLDNMLKPKEFSAERTIAEKMYKLQAGELNPSIEEDKHLMTLITIWGFINECSILYSYDIETNKVPALFVPKSDAHIIDAYKQARAKNI